jgi:AcrR family transcriptional regulator
LVSPARILELRDQGLTLRDIAARCGVSKTSVIRALNQQ